MNIFLRNVFLISLTILSLFFLASCKTTTQQNTQNASAKSYALGKRTQIASKGHYGFYRGHPSNRVYYFKYDDNTVNSDYFADIKAQAQYLAAHSKMHIRLEGNTDARGSREYNIALGERRALSVEEILLANGVKRSQIKAVSYGKEKPVAFGDTEAAYHLNRRVRLVYQQR